MSSKGQKYQKWDTNLVEIIRNELTNNRSVRELSRIYGIPRGTISNWQQIQRYPEKYKKKEKMPKPVTLEDWKERYEILKKHQAFLKA
jgi:transposase-like protein